MPDVPEQTLQPDQRRKVLVELACVLYQKELLSFGKARELAGMKFMEFQSALHDRQIPRYTLEMFEEDMRHVRGQ